jgi:hypothetical protein
MRNKEGTVAARACLNEQKALTRPEGLTAVAEATTVSDYSLTSLTHFSCSEYSSSVRDPLD